MKWEQNELRAFAGVILLILAMSSIFTKYETDTLQYLMIALIGFLAGGALFQKTNKE